MRALRCLFVIVLFVVVLFGAAVSPAAQPFRPHFRPLAPEAGLGPHAVTAALVDRHGYLWLGTEDGLYRYDGYGATRFTGAPSAPAALADGAVRALHERADGTLWVGTDAGLLRYEPGSGRTTAFRPDASDPTALPHDGVTALAEDAQGRLWVATRGGLGLLVDERAGRFQRFRHDPADAASLPGDDLGALLVDRHGRLWVGTRGAGLARLDPVTERFVVYRHDPANPASLPHDDVVALRLGADGAVWVGTAGGLGRLDPSAYRFTVYRHAAADASSLPSDRVSAVWPDRRGTVWVGTWDAGLARLDPRTGRSVRYRHDPADPGSLAEDAVRSLYGSPDASGLLWIGTAGGVAVLDPAQERFGLVRHDPRDPAGLLADDVRAFAETRDGALWVGTQDGLDRRDPATGRSVHFVHEPGRPSSLGGAPVRALLADRRGTLWVGTDGGLDRYDARTGGFDHFPHDPAAGTAAGGPDGANRVDALVEGADGTLWVGTRRGLYAFDPVAELFVRQVTAREGRGFALTADAVVALAEGPGGILWVGTPEGLNRLDPVSGYVTPYRHDARDAATLPHDHVLALLPTAGAVWVGTRGGLARLDVATGHVRRYGGPGGPPAEPVHGLLQDGHGGLWLSTARGLLRFDPAAGTARAYDAADGLQGGAFNPGAAYRAANGDLLFGGRRGYNRFVPGAIADNAHAPPVVLTDFRVAGRSVAPDRTADGAIRLSRDQRSVAFEFAALDFVDPARNRYRFMLEGFDEAWQEAGTRRYVSYTNLPGGRYVFRVQAANSDGVWNEAGLALPVVVAPSFRETVWFRLGLMLLVLGLGFCGALAWQRRRLRALEQQRDAVVEAKRRLGERQERERLHLARALHEGPVQDLYSASLQLRSAARALGANGTLTPVERALEGVGGTLRALGGALRPPTLGPFGLAAALRAHVEGLRAAHPQIRFDLALAPDGQQLPEDVRLALFRIAQEGLANAVHHARARVVRLTLTLEAGQAVLEVRDDGRGFWPPIPPLERARAGRFGLLAMTERAEALGGRLAVLSMPGKGTAVRATVPYPEGPAGPPAAGTLTGATAGATAGAAPPRPGAVRPPLPGGLPPLPPRRPPRSPA